MKDEKKDWFSALKTVEVYPHTKDRFWKSPQCDGCYHILLPTEDITDFIEKHFPHRAAVIDNLPMPEHITSNWDSTSFNVRRSKINATREKLLIIGAPPAGSIARNIIEQMARRLPAEIEIVYCPEWTGLDLMEAQKFLNDSGLEDFRREYHREIEPPKLDDLISKLEPVKPADDEPRSKKFFVPDRIINRKKR